MGIIIPEDRYCLYLEKCYLLVNGSGMWTDPCCLPSPAMVVIILMAEHLGRALIRRINTAVEIPEMRCNMGGDIRLTPCSSCDDTAEVRAIQLQRIDDIDRWQRRTCK